MAKRKPARPRRTFDARPDLVDFRDQMYQPTLIEVLPSRPLEQYRKWRVPILDQGAEGACTGYGLATVANYLLRCRAHSLGLDPRTAGTVSPKMLYHLARRYDEWPGQHYEGSSARGAMKGWHKHGVCAEKLYQGRLSTVVAQDALQRPLGAYYRVNHKDIVAMHSALTEVGALFVTSVVHAGWDDVGRTGMITLKDKVEGGHAFAFVGYDAEGFWFQNSWGADWGKGGFGHLTYDDWLRNGTDAWVARLGAPVEFSLPATTARGHAASARSSDIYTFNCLRPHVVAVGNDGALRPTGPMGNDAHDIDEMFGHSIPATLGDWKGGPRRLLLYAHGGLVKEDAALQRVADYRGPLLDHHVYPLALIWKTDYWTTLRNVLEDAIRRRRPEGFLDDSRDFMLDRLDDALEPLARSLSGKMTWDEMKENAIRAMDAGHAAKLVVDRIGKLLDTQKDLELHIAGHSAGGIFMAPIVSALGDAKRTIASCTLWAPACTVELFDAHYLPGLRSGAIKRLALFTLTDDAERADDCARIYHKSLLYLVSNAFEAQHRIPVIHPEGEPIIGLAKFIERHKELQAWIAAGDPRLLWVKAPNQADVGTTLASHARHHGDFDDDPATVKSTLALILGKDTAGASVTFQPSASHLQDIRRALPGR